MFDGDQARLRMAYSLQFALPGTPTLFYGEEIGMAENLDVPDRLAVRTPMQWTAGPTAGFSTAPADALVRPVPSDPRFAPDAVNVERQRRDPDSLLNWFERLIRRRKELAEIGWGTCTVLDADAPSVLVLNHSWRGSSIVTVHNVAGRRATARIAVDDVAPDEERRVDLEDLFEGVAPITPRGGRFTVPLPAYGHRWFRVCPR
jgi:glycosidase